MKQDIQNIDDIKILINTFYDVVKKDDTIGFIFNEIIGEDWSEHLPVMYRFWNTVLFGEAGYTGNPVMKHIALDKQIPLQEAHYTTWLRIWTNTVDDLYSGSIAEDAKKKAGNMVQLISMKVNMARDGKAIM